MGLSFAGWAAVVVGLVLAVRLAWSWWRVWVTGVRGCGVCGRCGYDLGGHEMQAAGVTCPECGARQRAGDLKRPVRWRRRVAVVVLCGMASGASFAGSRMARDGVFCLLPNWALIWLVQQKTPVQDLLWQECSYRAGEYRDGDDPTPLLRAMLMVSRPVRQTWPRGYAVVSEPFYLGDIRHRSLSPIRSITSSVDIRAVRPRSDRSLHHDSTWNARPVRSMSCDQFEATVADELHGLVYFQTFTKLRGSWLVSMLSIPMTFVDSIDEVILPQKSPSLTDLVVQASAPTITYEFEDEYATLSWSRASPQDWPKHMASTFQVELRRGGGRMPCVLTQWCATGWAKDEPLEVGLTDMALSDLRRDPVRPGDMVVITGDQAIALWDRNATMYWAGEVAWPAEEVFKSFFATPAAPNGR